MLKGLFKKFIPSFLLSFYHFFLAFLGAVFYGFPAKKLTVIGVTGTNGKSTVVELATEIFKEAGYKVTSISSIQFRIKDRAWLNLLKQTMPGRFQLQRFLRKAVDENCQYAVLEVTSEGIKQHRHKFIDFDVAVFTNLAPEHIEAHGSFEKYRVAKGKLFQATKGIHIINLDDKNANYFQQFLAKEKYGYTIRQLTINNQQLTILKADKINLKSTGSAFSISNTKFNLSLLGNFNIYNAMAAICIGLSQSISLEACKKALEKIEGIPGRMEEVVSQPFQVFVDYAFTPSALEKVYQTLTQSLNHSATQSLICVLGAAGGGRDKWKRPVLGQIAAKYCHQIIITNEDPYDEDPNQILSMIKSGISKSPGRLRADSPEGCFPMTNFNEILDRRKAINKALSLAQQNDTVIITGKGCEPWICVAKGKKISWDDRKVVREEFELLKNQ